VGIGTFTSTISGLQPNTTYYVRAYATNNVGTAYGNQVTCTTSATVQELAIIFGNGTVLQPWPYNTLWMDSRTQMLYPATEMLEAGGIAGMSITQIGLNISTVSTQIMNGFQIKIKNTTRSNLSAGYESGTSTVYSGTYAVPSSGWQMIQLQTPFIWDGSNLLIEICYDNNSYTTSSTVFCTTIPNLTQHYYFDGTSTSGCNSPYTGLKTDRPNIQMLVSGPFPVASYSIGNGNSCINATVNGGYSSGIPLTAQSTVTMQALVAAPGIYSVTTGVINGFSFSGSGLFLNSGTQTITLTGTGTPMNAGINSFIATASNSGGACTFTVTVYNSGEPCSGIPTVTYGERVYHTVQIGSQCWMKENLNIGLKINSSQSQTNNGEIEKFCYSDLKSNCDVYGGLYQWNEMMQYVSTPGAQGICPSGWHVPSDSDWTTLTDFLGGVNIAGGSMKDTGFEHWLSPNAGATNQSGFSAFGAGYYGGSGTNFTIKATASFSASSEATLTDGYVRELVYSGLTVTRNNRIKTNAFSVRCMRNPGSSTYSPTVTTSAATNITQTTAFSGGNVINDGGASVTARGVCWSTAANPTISDNHTVDGSGTGTFTSTISGLTSSTVYFIRAYATNSIGTTYGSLMSFVTLPGFICGSPYTDSRDGRTYNTVLIGNSCWMAQNLNIGNRINSYDSQTNDGITEKYCYDDLESNCNIYGGLYEWGEMVQYLNGASDTSSWNPVPNTQVQGICPSGWHIPNDQEWIAMISLLGGSYSAGGKMKETGFTHWLSPNTGATNSSGFTALGGGQVLSWFGWSFFSGLKESSVIWSSTESDSTQGNCYWLYNSDEGVYSNYDQKMNGNSVRCVIDLCTATQTPTVITTSFSNITQSTLNCSGNVTSDGGASVTARGICWSASPNPTVTNSHTSDGSGIGTFTGFIMGLATNTVYYFRAYATNSVGTSYGNELVINPNAVITLGTSANGLGYGVNGGQRTMVWADDNLKTVINFHRMGPGTTPPSLSGYLAADIGTTLGQSLVNWTNNRQVYAATLNSGGTYYADAARYPQAALYNPLGNTDPSNAYIGYFAANLSDVTNTWGGYSRGIQNLVNQADSTKHLIWNSPHPNHYIPDGFTISQQGIALSVDVAFNQSDFLYYDTLILNRGTWNAASRDFTYAESYLFLFSDNDQKPKTPRVAFSPDGQTAWIVALVNNWEATQTGAYKNYYPVLFKSVNAGLTWSGPYSIQLDGPNGINGIKTLLSDYRIQQLFSSPYPTRDQIGYTTAYDCDLAVDKWGNPHIGVVVGLTESDYTISNSDSCFAVFDIYSTNGGGSWQGQNLGHLKKFRGNFGGSSEDNRVNVATSMDGKKMFFTWLDTQVPWSTDNSQPDIFARGFDLVTNKLTGINISGNCVNLPNNVTEPTPYAHNAPFECTSHYVFTSAGDWIIPIVFEELTGNDINMPVTFKYIPDFKYSANDFCIDVTNPSIPTQPMTIAAARAMPVGSTVLISGIVTNGSELGIIRYLQDTTAGIAAYGSPVNNISRGDSVLIQGVIKNYCQLLELDPVNWITSVAPKPIPEPILITPDGMNEQNESTLVKMMNVTFYYAGGIFSGNTNYNVASGGQICQVRVNSNSNLVGQMIPSDQVMLIGICSQFHYSNPSAGYQLLLRDVNDIIHNSSSLQNITIASGQSNCFDAGSTITVAGGGTNFTVQPGGSATLIAGQKISFLPTTTVQNGGYLWGYIAPNGPFCQSPSLPSAVSQKDSSMKIEERDSLNTSLGITILPNPTNGRFVLEFSIDPGEKKVEVEIYNLMGRMIQQKNLEPGRKHEFSLESQQPGLYLVKVSINGFIQTIKIIRSPW